MAFVYGTVSFIVELFLMWMPPLFQVLVFALFGIFGFYVICKLVKLLWDLIPVA